MSEARLAPVLAVLVLMVALSLPAEGPGLPPCPFRAVTGLPCAACGLTRGVISAARGEWRGAFRLHPLAPLLAGALWATAAMGLLPVAWRARLWRPLARARRGILAALVGLLLVNGLFRLVWVLLWQRPSLW